MFFDTSKFYCKYVISIIESAMKKLQKDNELYEELDEKLFQSYLKLEEIIKLQS